METPCFVIEKEILDSLTGELINAISKIWPNTLVGYSFKTNSNAWVIEYMKKKGFYAEVVSDDEYSTSQQFGYDNKVIYNGIIKDKSSFLDAVRKHCIVNIDSQREIEWLSELPHDCQYEVGLRVNFDIESMCPGQSSGGEEGSRFGFCYENGKLKEALDKISTLPNVRVVGIHLHSSSNSRSLDIYRAIATIACKIEEEYKLNLKYVDIGGGFFGGVSGKPGFADYLSLISEILKKTFNSNTLIIMEPGMSLIGASISYYTSVIDVKETTRNNFVVTDGSRMHIDPLLRKSSYTYEIHKNTPTDKLLGKQVICGFTCMENDRLFELIDSPNLSVSDNIIYKKVGAYTMCLAPQFIKFLPTVYLNDYGNIQVVEDRWKTPDVYRKDIL